MRVAALALALVAVLIGTACGGSDEASQPEDATSQPEDAIEGYLNALAEGDGEAACGHLSLNVRAQVADCPAAAEEFTEFLGEDAARLNDAEVSNVSVDGDSASASVSLAGETVTVELAEVEGEWRIDTFRFANQLLGIED